MINSAVLLLVFAQPLFAILFNLDFDLPPPIVHQLPPEPPGCCSPIQCAFANSRPPCPVGGAGLGGGGGGQGGGYIDPGPAPLPVPQQPYIPQAQPAIVPQAPQIPQYMGKG